MFSIPSSVIRFFDAVLLRGAIFAFVFLELQFTRMFIFEGAEAYPYLAMWGTVFVDATAIIILNLLYGEHSVGRDTNTLNFYGIVCHLVYIPLFYGGYHVGAYHNIAIKCINALIVLRLFYFGSRDLLANIAIIERAKKWLLSDRFLLNHYVNGLTFAIFLLCAIPLCTLIYLINTDEMRITGIAVILFSFFVAFDIARKRKAGISTIDVQQAATGKSVSAVTRARVLRLVRRARREVAEMRGFIKFVYLGSALIFICLLAVTEGTIKRDTIFSYATGYVDAKTGKPPRVGTDIQKLMKCFNVKTEGKPPPPTKECIEMTNFKP